jgi:hypothetical protein
LAKLGPWVVIAVAAPLAAGTAILEFCSGRAHLVVVAFVAATALASGASLYATAYARRRGQRALSTPPAIASLVLSASCILLARHIILPIVVIWAANLAMSAWSLTRAVKVDRMAHAVDAARRNLDWRDKEE